MTCQRTKAEEAKEEKTELQAKKKKPKVKPAKRK